mmetsp:Transcript_18275/g.46165  ORF Transcript_18275/g.46165 Transcript_18275/m.46165 type:complete len:294 (-) Transcript_18275:76-957(-)
MLKANSASTAKRATPSSSQATVEGDLRRVGVKRGPLKASLRPSLSMAAWLDAPTFQPLIVPPSLLRSEAHWATPCWIRYASHMEWTGTGSTFLAGKSREETRARTVLLYSLVLCCGRGAGGEVSRALGQCSGAATRVPPPPRWCPRLHNGHQTRARVPLCGCAAAKHACISPQVSRQATQRVAWVGSERIPQGQVECHDGALKIQARMPVRGHRRHDPPVEPPPAGAKAGQRAGSGVRVPHQGLRRGTGVAGKGGIRPPFCGGILTSRPPPWCCSGRGGEKGARCRARCPCLS